MQIYIDSADIDQINEAISWGIVDGITTNPSLIKQAAAKHLGSGGPDALKEYIFRVLEAAQDRPVSLEVIGPGQDEMLVQGRYLYETFNGAFDNVVVKVPVNPNTTLGGDARYDGLKVISAFADDGIPVNTTLIFTPEQALLAAKAGARYVSPFAGRIDDRLREKAGMPADKLGYFPLGGLRGASGEVTHSDNGVVSGVHLIEEVVTVLEGFDFECEVLAASIRNPRQARECALVGSDIATIPFGVIRAMIEHDQTVSGMQAFLDDVVPEYRDLFPRS